MRLRTEAAHGNFQNFRFACKLCGAPVCRAARQQEGIRIEEHGRTQFNQLTLRMSPAMAAGITDRLWSLEDVIAKIDELAPALKARGPYRKRENSN